MLCRRILDQQPNHAEAHNLIGRVLLALGAPGLAVRSFRRALAANPNFKSAHKNLADAESRAIAKSQSAVSSSNAGRFLVIREWMEGFWSDVDHVVGMCMLAEITGRMPIVHWGGQSRYRTADGSDAWRTFFAPVSQTKIDDALAASQSGGHVYPTRYAPPGNSPAGTLANRWTGPESRLTGLRLLGRDEAVVVSDFHSGVIEMLPYVPEDHPLFGKSVHEARHLAMARYLRPTPEIVAAVDDFVRQHFGSAPVLGVHLRATDKVTEQADLAAINAQYPAAIARALAGRPDMKVFVMTDSEPFVAQCKAQFGDRVITTQAVRSSGTVGLHYMPHEGDRTHLGREVLIDTLIGTRCERFIGLASSNVSVFVRDLKNWAPGSCELFAKAYSDRANLAIYRVPPPPGAT